MAEQISLEQKELKAREISIKEGIAASASASFGSSYITPFALALNASSFVIGAISSLAGLVNPLAQIMGSKLMEKFSRKSIVLTAVLIEALLWIPIALLGFLAIYSKSTSAFPIILLCLITLLMIAGGLAHPPWFSWMGDIIPEEERGKYFSRRNRATGIASVIVLGIVAIILDIAKTNGLALAAFTAMFLLASASRLISYRYFLHQYIPKFRAKKSLSFSFLSFVKRFDNFGKFAFFQGSFYLAVMIASPFFAVYMLKELNFSYTTYTLLTIASSLVYLLATPLAGRFSDRYGNKKLLIIASICFILTPLIWLFTNTPWYALIPQLTAGIGTAALVIGTTNFTYDAVSREHRGICVAYTNLLVGIGTFIGSLLGGILLSITTITLANSFILLFIVATIARILPPLIFLPKIKEEKRSYSRLPPMHISLAHPFKTVHAEIGWAKHVLVEEKPNATKFKSSSTL